MKTWLWKNRFGLFLLLLVMLLLLPSLGMSPLIDPDEPVYGETAKEMLQAGDWLSPRIFGQFWYDKPPLFYWLEMIFYSLFGISDYTSRLPSAIMGIATIAYVYDQGKRIFNKDIAFISSLVLTTSIGFIYIGKASVTDMTLLFTLTVTMISFYRRQYFLAYVFCGLALLAKGPIGYGFPALIMLIYILVCRRWSLLKTMKIPQGILLAFLVGLPWYIYMYRVHGSIFFDTFIGYNNITRFLAPEHPGQNKLYFFIPVLLAFMLPWSAAIVPAVIRFVKKHDPFKDALTFCFIWAAFILIFYSISQTQLVTYIAPMFPPTAFLIGWYIYRCLTEDALPKIWILTMVILGVLFLSCNMIPLNEGAEYFKPVVLWCSLCFAMITLIPSLLLYKKYWKSAMAVITIIIAIFTTTVFSMLLPALEDHIASRHIAQKMSEVYDGVSPVYIDKFIRPGFAFYSGLYGTELSYSKKVDFAHSDKTYFFMQKFYYKQVTEPYHIPHQYPIVETSEPLADFTHSGKTYYIMQKSYYKELIKQYPVIEQYPILAETPAQLIVMNHT